MSHDKSEGKTEILSGEEKLLLDHDYDGIKELDHVLPRWWLWILYGTIVFSAWYVGYYMSGFGPSSQQELASEMKEIEAQKTASTPVGGNRNAEDEAKLLLAASKDVEKIKIGGTVYGGKCAACHGDKGQGLVGPNLADDFWIHGKGTLPDIANVISVGVAEKGMPPWGPILTPDELINTVAFVRSFRGTGPAGAKSPQGDKQEHMD